MSSRWKAAAFAGGLVLATAGAAPAGAAPSPEEPQAELILVVDDCPQPLAAP
ncbi:hypothetical protein [Acrocarpospora catenulata]|uniref:hypothetical protein n=1 Tax=Acrocarpospora catenulata TaxID=2836182 RepID=UPI001BD99855|nr:hypothetical protein [Acrocarpospora catenulata]